MRKCFALIFVCSTLVVTGQTVPLVSGTLTLCEGVLTDPGGVRNYGDNESIVATLCPATPGTQLALAFEWSDIRRGDSLCIYDGLNAQAPELTCSTRWTGARLLAQASAANTSGCLTLSWATDAHNNGAGFEAQISCAAVCQQVRPRLANPDGGDSLISFVELCPGELIDLRATVDYPQNHLVYSQSPGTTTYRWTLPNGQERTGQQLLTALAQPGGYSVSLEAFDERGCKSIQPHLIRLQVAAPPVFEVDSEALNSICAPNVLSFSWGGAQSSLSASTPTQFFEPVTSRTDSLPLPDGTGAAHESSIYISQFPEGATLQSVDDLVAICASMEHSWLRDLSMELVSPDGRVATLHDHPGRFGDENFLGEPVENDVGNAQPVPGVGYTYCWNDSDPKGDWLRYLNQNPQLQTLPAGTYRSYDPLSVFVGCPLNGAWTLRILDHWEADNGWIFEWDLQFADHLPVAIDSFRTELVDGAWHRDYAQSAYSPQAIAYAPTLAGTVQPCLTVANSFGCRYDTSLLVNVRPSGASACGPCEPTIDTLPQQTVFVGDTVRFDLHNAGRAGASYRYVGASPVSFASNPPSRPLRLPLSVSEPPVAVLDAQASQLGSVCVRLQSDRADELSLQLTSPSGQQITLWEYGSPASWQGERCFALSAQGDTIASVDRWDDLALATAEGTWQLAVHDARGFQDTSVIEGYQLNFLQGSAAEIVSPPGVIAESAGAFYALPTADQDYTFSYLDAGGCERVLVFPVQVRIPCQLSLKLVGTSPPRCPQGSDAAIAVTALGNQGEVTYSLGALRNTDGKFENLPAGDHVIEAVDSALCPASLAVLLREPVGLQIEQRVEVAQCEPIRYDVDIERQPAVAIVESSWLDDASLSAGFRQNLSPGTYTLRSVDTSGCTTYTTVSLPNRSEPIVEVLAQSPSCRSDADGRLTVDITGAAEPWTVVWNDGEQGPARTALAPGTYAGSVVDSFGCETSFAARLADLPALRVEVEVENNWCANEATGAVALTIVDGAPPYLARVDDGPWEESSLLFDLAEGDHLVEVRDANACTWDSLIYVATLSTLSDTLELIIDDSPYGEPTRIDAASGKHGAITRTQWRYSGEGDLACDTCVATTLTPYSSGILWAIVEDTLGCRVEGSLSLVIQQEPELLVPTAFTPGGSTFDNRLLRVHGRSGTVIESFVVFDRWGTQVYAEGGFAVNAPRGWDGRYRGEPAPAGNYLYEVTAKMPSGTTRRIRGSTTLLR